MVRDMTVGSPSKILVTFALPMILGNVFQQLYNIVDSVVVGNFVGSDALAAVGASYSVTFLFVAVATGASIGCSVVISQFYGAKRVAEMKSSVYTALTSMMTLSALLLLAGLLLARPLLLLMRTPGNIFSDADAYLRIYVAAVPFLFLYNTSTAAFNALGDSRHPPLAADALVDDQHLPRPALCHSLRDGGAGRRVGDPHRAGARLAAGVFCAAAPPQADAVRGEAPRL